jgi:molecular chaperone GrpE
MGASCNSDTDELDLDENLESEDQNTLANESDEVLKSQLAETKKSLLEALAEVENTKKRSEKEKENISKYCIRAFASDVITVRDSLVSALEVAKENPRISKGLDMVLNEIDRVLATHGIFRIDCRGKKFNPDLHNAVAEVQCDGDEQSGTVSQVLQEGFTIGGRVLRPALVVVAK